MERTIPLLSAVPYLRAYHGQTFVVKLGGDLLADPTLLGRVARDIAVLHRLRVGIVVVHGGGPQLSAMTQRLGLQSETVAGRRVTSPEVLEAAKMVFRGTLSIDLVSALATAGERAVGLSGADGDLVTARKRPPVEVVDDDGEARTVDYGAVGDVEDVDPSVLKAVLGAGSIPVVCALGADGRGDVFNVNADTVAAELAIAMGAAKLILLTRAPGILADAEDPASLLHWADLRELDRLESEGAFSGGMRPKVAAVRRALDGGVPRVHVVDGRRDGSLLEEVFTTEGCGTLVVLQADQAPAEPIV